MRVVLDTNVVVSGLLNPHGPPGRIVDGLLAGDIVALVDDRILHEYRSVLSRPKFRFDKSDIDDFLVYVASQSEHVLAIPVSGTFPDPDDACFIEVAIAGHAVAVVTGNLKHFPPDAVQDMPVLSPREFLDTWRQSN